MTPARLFRMLRLMTTHRGNSDVIPAFPEGKCELSDDDLQAFGIWKARGGYQLATRCDCGEPACTGCDLAH
jgi:hypothetical protein